jgi:hemerythrin-like metal-binding protein
MISIMDTLAWSDRFISGHQTIDAQHEAIFAALDNLADACVGGDNPAAIGHFIDLCRTHIVEHFRDEEAEMVRIGYPADALAKHRTAHAAVAAAVFDLVESEAKGERISARHALTVAHLMSNHIKTEDVPFIRAARAVWKPGEPHLPAPSIDAPKPAKQAARPAAAKRAKKPAK